MNTYAMSATLLLLVGIIPHDISAFSIHTKSSWRRRPLPITLYQAKGFGQAKATSVTSKSAGAANSKNNSNSIDNTKPTGNNNINTSSSSENLRQIYSAPALYDLAMGYRNYESEVEFLLWCHQQYSTQACNPGSILEVASGPGRHCMEALKRHPDTIKRVIALDLSQDMVDYGKGVANDILSDEELSRFTFLCEDMRSFVLGNSVDSAWILAGSLQHMTTNNDVIQSLEAIHRALTANGTLIIELPHPNEAVFEMMDSTTNSWEVPLEDSEGKTYGELKVVWGDKDDEIDPIQQVRQNTVVLNLEGVPDAENQSVKGVVPLKLFTAQEIDLLAKCSGFKVAAMYGALNEEVDIHNEDTAYRLVCVLNKV